MLDDPDLINGVYQKIYQNLSAPAAWHEHIELQLKHRKLYQIVYSLNAQQTYVTLATEF